MFRQRPPARCSVVSGGGLGVQGRHQRATHLRGMNAPVSILRQQPTAIIYKRMSQQPLGAHQIIPSRLALSEERKQFWNPLLFFGVGGGGHTGSQPTPVGSSTTVDQSMDSGRPTPFVGRATYSTNHRPLLLAQDGQQVGLSLLVLGLRRSVTKRSWLSLGNTRCGRASPVMPHVSASPASEQRRLPG